MHMVSQLYVQAQTVMDAWWNEMIGWWMTVAVESFGKTCSKLYFSVLPGKLLIREYVEHCALLLIISEIKQM